MKFLGVAALVAGSLAHAQNSDLGLLAGISGPKGSVVTAGTNTVISGSVGASGQINYAWQIFQRSVDLYVEMPLVFSGQDAGTVRPAVVSSTSAFNLFFTPGLRVKISPQSRVSFYGALGGGLASLAASQSTVSPGTVVEVTHRVTAPALDFGGGFDFRLTRLLSLRGEGRDFVTRAGLGGSVGRNRWMAMFGIAFHF